MVKTRKWSIKSIIICITVVVVVCGAGYYIYKLSSPLKAGDTFTSGNTVMDSIRFSDSKTPIAKKNAEVLFNSSKATIATVGNYGLFDNGVLYKEYFSKNYSITVSPVLNADGSYNITYAVVNISDSGTNVGDIIRLDFICNGKEIQPSSNSNGNTDGDYNHKVVERLCFNGITNGDEFTVIFYNYAETSAIAFPFTVQ